MPALYRGPVKSRNGWLAAAMTPDFALCHARQMILGRRP
jgi:hypothetical protein